MKVHFLVKHLYFQATDTKIHTNLTLCNGHYARGRVGIREEKGGKKDKGGRILKLHN
jgi:hypothetical protein